MGARDDQKRRGMRVRFLDVFVDVECIAARDPQALLDEFLRPSELARVGGALALVAAVRLIADRQAPGFAIVEREERRRAVHADVEAEEIRRNGDVIRPRCLAQAQ